MSIRGWVYVISNAAMPGLLKIGFSLKDPTLRARELASTGSPFPYKVEYEALLDNPREVEQRAHQNLTDQREGREWFRCTFDQAVAAIKSATDNQILFQRQYELDVELLGNGEAQTGKLSELTKNLKYRPIGTYGGECSHCGAYFTATLNPSDQEMKCPKCLRRSEIASFRRREFII